ncbi:TorF family putative porin [Aromatoleum toluclasticum]|uniref:TorF family putative porin n=1 Tax=Aromatoleum toluclasticum TaxID=92003 RepID=UPI00035C7D15|nr:TorF family putative porin [Aromatoleum toluclasticum]MCC4114001.1 TorF family putative porin [Aromatoleum toluclasticum]
MHKRIIALAVAAALPLIASGTAAAADSPIAANVALVSDYAYRGISQTDEKPALQGGFDYAHASGLYVGVWGSNVSWLSDLERGTGEHSGNSLELDVYGGYKGTVGDIGYDVGLLQYVYPGEFDSGWRTTIGLKKPNTLEGYVGLSWQFLSFKYSNSFTNLFGAPDSKGSQYFDLSAAYEVIPGTTLNAHVGHQKIAGPALSYTDWKVGVSQVVAGVTLGLHYVDTNLKDKEDLNADGRYVVSVSKTF